MTFITSPTLVRWRLTVDGTVQGVGFRPFIYQLASRYRLAGWVRNTGEGVLIEVEGPAENLPAFAEAIRTKAPPLARVGAITHTELAPLGDAGFTIHESGARNSARAGIPPDVATCPDCLADIMDPANRRYQYPFTNCTNCGPRFTIIKAVPYDRPQTTMRNFTLCPACKAEYDDPGDRRFHAQPNACPVCGPHLALDGISKGDVICIAETAQLLREGKIIALKGLGGYHLCCDARNPEAVQTLRTRKGRAGKPFALMCPTLEAARQLCEIDVSEEALLLAHERPIMLLSAKADNGIAPQVAPGVGTLGIMLPYTPLHHLLLAAFDGPLVMTSGNLSDEPIAYIDAEAQQRLGRIADHFLTHNRPIHLTCDDSLVRSYRGTSMPIRRARGFVPQTIKLIDDGELRPVFAAGGDLKNTFCLTRGREALLSQHLGDLENPVSLDHYQRMVEHFCNFFAVQPQVVAHDLHPDYQSTRFAKAWQGVEHIAVQHHHAHIASCMAEHGLAGPVIGIAFDGTGFGTDGVIWGGEFFIADYHGFRRAAHLSEISLPGGEAAIRKPARIALAHLLSIGLSPEEAAHRLPGMTDAEAKIVAVQVVRGIQTPHTTSMGRLFDAVSALLGIVNEVTYEGQAAIEMETAALQGNGRVYPYIVEPNAEGALVIDVRPLITALCADKSAIPERAAAFHATVADMTVTVCERLRNETGLADVALSGGVFQNITLLTLIDTQLAARGFTVYRHELVPCTDGGLSLGQAAIAARRKHT